MSGMPPDPLGVPLVAAVGSGVACADASLVAATVGSTVALVSAAAGVAVASPVLAVVVVISAVLLIAPVEDSGTVEVMMLTTGGTLVIAPVASIVADSTVVWRTTMAEGCSPVAPACMVVVATSVWVMTLVTAADGALPSGVVLVWVTVVVVVTAG